MNTLSMRTTLAAALLVAAPLAQARPDGEGWDYARVLSAEPIWHTVEVRTPRRECTEEPVTERTVHRGHSDPGSILIGAVIGGVIGHQFGSGRGNDAATAAGAVIGASQGARGSYQNGRVVERTVMETRCRRATEVRSERRIDGYDVTYKYRGRIYTTRTERDPGDRIRVRERMDVYED